MTKKHLQGEHKRQRPCPSCGAEDVKLSAVVSGSRVANVCARCELTPAASVDRAFGGVGFTMAPLPREYPDPICSNRIVEALR